jgi:pimeloyl-ACP methyl ester carboxylesterase
MRTHEPFAIHLESGEALRGDLHFTESPGESAVIFTHGFGSNRNGAKSQALEQACARTGWTYTAFDCRGHGESDGTMHDFRQSRLLEDLEAVRGFLRERGVRQLYLVGSSMGGFASAWFALRCADVRACVFLAPAFRFLERRLEALSAVERAHWRKTGFIRYQSEWIDVEVGYGVVEEWPLYRFEQLAPRWTKPALIFHGLADDAVPADDSIEFLRQAPGAQIELRLFKNGDHRLTTYKDELAAEACRFFQGLR